jgi:hypothetical protein
MGTWRLWERFHHGLRYVDDVALAGVVLLVAGMAIRQRRTRVSVTARDGRARTSSMTTLARSYLRGAVLPRLPRAATGWSPPQTARRTAIAT